jgi:hypothetical protein
VFTRSALRHEPTCVAGLRTRLGKFAMFAAIRRASSRVSSLAADFHPALRVFQFSARLIR